MLDKYWWVEVECRPEKWNILLIVLKISGFVNECESLIIKINFYLCGKHSEISLNVEASCMWERKLMKWHPLLLHSYMIIIYFEIPQGTFKRFMSIDWIFLWIRGAKFSMKIKCLLIVSKLILLLEIEELFKSWERPAYVIKSEGSFAFPHWKYKKLF